MAWETLEPKMQGYGYLYSGLYGHSLAWLEPFGLRPKLESAQWLPFDCFTRLENGTTATPPAPVSGSSRLGGGYAAAFGDGAQSLMLNELATRECRPGVSRSTNLWWSSAFIRLNVIIATVIILVLAFLLRAAAARQYTAAIHRIGFTPFLIRANAADTTRERFLSHVLDAVSASRCQPATLSLARASLPAAVKAAATAALRLQAC